MAIEDLKALNKIKSGSEEKASEKNNLKEIRLINNYTSE